MGLVSVEFGLFFVCFFALYWAFWRQPRAQSALLTLTSLALLAYYASWVASACFVAFTMFAWLVSRGMDALPRIPRKAWLWIGIGGGVAHLAFWKYAEFFRVPLRETLAAHGFGTGLLESTWLLPLGVSYYTFQGISYLHARYRREIDGPLRLSLFDLLGHFGLFLTITSGPILRARNAKHLTAYDGSECNGLDQIRQATPRKVLAPTLALTLILLALAKKWWLAGWLSESLVDPVFANPSQFQSLDVLAAIYGYTLQLFFDFSGYSDLVVGLGMLLGLRIPVNFRAPLLASNIREFWDRWHISLSVWIRDYLYIPLGGSKHGFSRTQLNLFIALVLSGLWHGQGWNFALWGFLHASALVLLNIGDRVFDGREKLTRSGWPGKALGVFVTVNFVCFAFVFFRATHLADAIAVFRALFGNLFDTPIATDAPLWLLAMLVALLAYPRLVHLPARYASALDAMPTWLRPAPLLATLALVAMFAPSGVPGFIYANF
ncbi:MAG: MBOAT family protein [Proteobacteria bacterium]|nr:MBOAT family protein [Pseudomonadota bacterium]